MKTQWTFHFIALLSCTLLLLWAGCGGDEDEETEATVVNIAPAEGETIAPNGALTVTFDNPVEEVTAQGFVVEPSKDGLTWTLKGQNLKAGDLALNITWKNKDGSSGNKSIKLKVGSTGKQVDVPQGEQEPEGTLLGEPNTFNITITQLSNGATYTMNNGGDKHPNGVLADAAYAGKAPLFPKWWVFITAYDPPPDGGKKGFIWYTLRLDIWQKLSSGQKITFPAPLVKLKKEDVELQLPVVSVTLQGMGRSPLDPKDDGIAAVSSLLDQDLGAEGSITFTRFSSIPGTGSISGSIDVVLTKWAVGEEKKEKFRIQGTFTTQTVMDENLE